MFRAAHLVLKYGEAIVRDGEPQAYRFGKALAVEAPHAVQMAARIHAHVTETLGVSASLLSVPAVLPRSDDSFGYVPCLA